MKNMLNVGCGYVKLQEAINIDIDPRCNPDMIVDLTKPLPFDDESFSKVYANQVLEHIFNYDKLMIEIHRVLKLGGFLYVSVPMWPSRNAVAPCGHVQDLVPESFLMFTNPTFFQPKGYPSDIQGLFEKVEMVAQKEDLDEGEPGSWITNLEVILKKVDKDYWKERGVTENLKTDVRGCFWCGYELELMEKARDNKSGTKVCPNCKEVYTFGM